MPGLSWLGLGLGLGSWLGLGLGLGLGSGLDLAVGEPARDLLVEGGVRHVEAHPRGQQ